MGRVANACGMLGGPAVLSIAAAVSFAAPAQAQQIGEVRCQDDGYVYSWFAMGGSGMWMNTFKKCDPSASSSRRRSSRNDYEEEEEDDRGSYERPSRRERYSEAADHPQDGDEKCGPDGNILKYSWYPALKRGRWYNTYRDCQ